MFCHLNIDKFKVASILRTRYTIVIFTIRQVSVAENTPTKQRI